MVGLGSLLVLDHLDRSLISFLIYELHVDFRGFFNFYWIKNLLQRCWDLGFYRQTGLEPVGKGEQRLTGCSSLGGSVRLQNMLEFLQPATPGILKPLLDPVQDDAVCILNFFVDLRTCHCCPGAIDAKLSKKILKRLIIKLLPVVSHDLNWSAKTGDDVPPHKPVALLNGVGSEGFGHESLTHMVK